MEEFSGKDRRRMRQFLELAHSTSFDGEREAALTAATRLAESYGMSLREAVGMSEREAPPKAHRPRPPRTNSQAHTPEHDAFHQRFKHGFGTHPKHQAQAAEFRTEAERAAFEKKMYEAAMAEAYRRGLDAELIKAQRRAEALKHARPKSNRWRPRAEFIRVLLKETGMSAREIAEVAGVTVYDVFREKLLLRSADA
ncbi:MAG: hypothetical protein KDE14_07000 [Rhodobacteraceae bacterium]|nr:hypothetical protein [Paracoccaceae bacterium]